MLPYAIDVSFATLQWTFQVTFIDDDIKQNQETRFEAVFGIFPISALAAAQNAPIDETLLKMNRTYFENETPTVTNRRTALLN